MLWNKKEEKKVEKSKKEFVIKKRIKALYDKLSEIHDTKTHEVINIWYWKEVSAFKHEDVWYFGFTLNTKYGERKILINDEYELYYGKDDLIKYKPYYTCGYECPFYTKSMFSLAVKTSVNIKPEPMVEFTPQEIDLAILEFENAIEPIYQEALKRESKHKACIEYLARWLMGSKDLQAVVKTQKAFIKELLDRLEGKEVKQPIELDFAKHSSFTVGGEPYTFGQVCMLLNDDYFKGLTIEQILELAKKSIRITTENRRLEDKIEKIIEMSRDVKSAFESIENCKAFLDADKVLELLEDKENEKGI